MKKYFKITGYWEDTLENFSDYIVSEEDYDDEDVFFYGLSEDEIQQAIKEPWDNNLEFIITEYEKL